MDSLVEAQGSRASLYRDIDALVQAVVTQASPLDRIVVMSNGGFDGVHERLLAALAVANPDTGVSDE